MRTLILSFFSLLPFAASSQRLYDLSFEGSPQFYFGRWFINDSLHYPHSKWQIGRPSKTVFTAAKSYPNALVTDTLNALPPNDTSVIYLKHARGEQYYHVFLLAFDYQLDGDTLDEAFIEVSPDTGHTWINILTEDTTYDFRWDYVPKPVLRGASGGWRWFHVDMSRWATGWTPYPTKVTADTVLFRFTYVTSAQSSGHDGWMIDNVHIDDWDEGVDDPLSRLSIGIYPNPARTEIRLSRKEVPGPESVSIFNAAGQRVYHDEQWKGGVIDVHTLPQGAYVLRYRNEAGYASRHFTLQ